VQIENERAKKRRLTRILTREQFGFL